MQYLYIATSEPIDQLITGLIKLSDVWNV